MNTETSQFSMFTRPDKKNTAPDIKNILNRYLYYWPAFVITLIITLTIAFFYQKLAKPQYDVKASLLIQDQKKTPDQQSALQEIELIAPSKIIENEIDILKSYQLISQVVKDLQLDVNYKIKDDFLSYSDLYTSSPVKLTFVGQEHNIDDGLMNIRIKDTSRFTLMETDGKIKEYLFNQVYTTGLGTWKVQPTSHLSKFIGKTIIVSLSNANVLSLQYQRSIDAILSNKLSTSVILSVTDKVEQRGKDILNSLINNYNLAASRAKKSEIERNIAFVDQRVDSLRRQLSSVEGNIASFKSSRGLTDLSANSKVSLDNMQANDSKLNDVNIQLNVIEGIDSYINSPVNSGKPPATMGINDQALTNSISKLADLETKRETLLGTTPATNPQFEPLNKQIAMAKANLKDNVNNIKQTLLITKNKLEGFNKTYQASIKDVPVEEQEFVDIKRQQSTKENLYTYLLKKREELAVSYAITLPNDRIVDSAYTVSAKGGQKTLAYAIALLMGIVLPAGVIYSKNLIGDKVTDVQEIKNAVNATIIGEIPQGKEPVSIVIGDAASNVISEQFRLLRSKLYHLYNDKQKGRVTLLTSSIPGEGKSFISVNLGIILANSDRKTIILELDLRKPQIAEMFDLPINKPGISNLLNRKAKIEDIIQNHPSIQNLSIISSGSEVDNPSELLERGELKRLILLLREIYDDIIIDSPPVHLVADAMILSPLTDVTLYVVRQGYTGREELSFIDELIQESLLKRVQIIFNGILRVKHGYGYNYSNSYYNKIAAKQPDVPGPKYLRRFLQQWS